MGKRNKDTRGRPRIEVAPDLFAEQVRNFNAREVTAEQAATALGISRRTFFRRLKAERYPDSVTGETLTFRKLKEGDAP